MTPRYPRHRMRRRHYRVWHQTAVNHAQRDGSFAGVAKVGFDNAIGIVQDGGVVNLTPRRFVPLILHEPPSGLVRAQLEAGQQDQQRAPFVRKRAPGRRDGVNITLIGLLRRRTVAT